MNVRLLLYISFSILAAICAVKGYETCQSVGFEKCNLGRCGCLGWFPAESNDTLSRLTHIQTMTVKPNTIAHVTDTL